MSREGAPALPRNTIRVGVSGHREIPAESLAGVRAAISQALAAVRDALDPPGRGLGLDAGAPARQVLISPLAEGADQLAAEVALELGYELQAAFPFPTEVYEQDFEAGGPALAAFRAFSARAASHFVLDGDRSSALALTQAYAAVGELVLAQCDVLLAVWDGQPARGEGGTAQVVREALQAGIPVIVVRPEADEPRLRLFIDTAEAGATEPDALREQVRSILFAEPPREELAAYARFLTEPVPGRGPRSGEALDASLAEAAPDDPRSASRLRARFGEHYRRADGLAIRYAKRYRRGFRGNYVLGALAVLLALLAHVVEDLGRDAIGTFPGGLSHAALARILVGLEAVSLLAILGVFALGRACRWLERAVQYRTLAEHFRQMMHLLPLGLAVPFSRPPAHLRECAGSQVTWMNVHFRAVLRDLGMPAVRCAPAYLESARAMLARDWIGPQRAFHAARAQALAHKLHRGEVLAMLCFLTALVAAILHLLHFAFPGGLLLVLAAGAPAWGAALHGIQSQGEYKRLSQRYASMARHLTELDARLAQAPASLKALQDLARTAAVEMIEEVNDWQVLYRAHVIPTP